MAGYNKVVMVGNLTRDPELKPVGAAHVCRMSLASNRSYKNRQTGAVVQEVCFVDVVVWGPQAENCAQYLQKGRPVLIEGRLKFDSWKDATDGKMRSRHSIVAENVIFLSNGQAAEATSMEGLEDAAAGVSAPAAKNGAAFKDEPPFDDELPF